MLDAVAPRLEPTTRIEPHYPMHEGLGRPPIGVAPMLRKYAVQPYLYQSDEDIEDAAFGSQDIRASFGIDFARESALDAATLLTFPRLLETHGLAHVIFDAINAHLAAKGLRQSSVIDANIIGTASSISDNSGIRYPEMP